MALDNGKSSELLSGGEVRLDWGAGLRGYNRLLVRKWNVRAARTSTRVWAQAWEGSAVARVL